MGDAAAYAYLAMRDAVADSGLDEEQVSNHRTGLIVGTGGTSTANMVAAADILRDRGARKVGPTMVPRVMSSTGSACLAVAYRIKGINYSIGSACATSAHCIGNACELIQSGKQDIIFAGGGDEVHWTGTLLFDGMGRPVVPLQRQPGRRLPPVRCGPGRVRHLRRRRHRRAGRVRTRAEPGR